MKTSTVIYVLALVLFAIGMVCVIGGGFAFGGLVCAMAMHVARASGIQHAEGL